MSATALNSLSRIRLTALAGLLSLMFGSPALFADDLIEATRVGDTEAVARLIADGADLNAAMGDGMTALHLAAQSGQLAIVETLLQAGAETDPTTRIGQYTPLHIASSRPTAISFASFCKPAPTSMRRLPTAGLPLCIWRPRKWVVRMR